MKLSRAIIDWRSLRADQVAPLYEEQTREWKTTLGWDLASTWAVVERARADGALPGLVSVDLNGRMCGWTFFMRQDEVLQIGALSGRGAGPVRELLEAVLDAPESTGARELTCLLFPARHNAISALARRRFQLQVQKYLTRPLLAAEVGAVAGIAIRRWRDDDALQAIKLLARAYAADPRARSIAPNGTLEEWAYHLGQILRTPACGALLARCSAVAEDSRSGAIVGLLLATCVGEDTAHVAQLAVAPEWQRRGIGRTLLQWSTRALSAERLARLTLLAPEQNDAAAALMARAGFVEAGQLVFASRAMPVRRQLTVARAA